MTFRAQFNVNLEAKARQASQQAAKAVFAELNGRFQDAIGSKAWPWPDRTTYRSGGPITGGPRTIVDTANLRGSNPGPAISGLRAEFRWGAPYATAVHEGAVIYPYGDRTRTPVILPMRPWTAAVLGTIPYNGIPVYDLRKRYAAVWLAKFRA